MFVLLSLEGFLFLKTKNKARKYMLAGVGFAALAAIFFMFKISPHQWFNYLCVSHIFMAAAATLLYMGTIRIDMSVIVRT
jgi:FtsH-binding integral membrane protein